MAADHCVREDIATDFGGGRYTAGHLYRDVLYRLLIYLAVIGGCCLRRQRCSQHQDETNGHCEAHSIHAVSLSMPRRLPLQGLSCEYATAGAWPGVHYRTRSRW